MSISIDRYRIERLLGEGGMGKVYLATDPKLNREVAVKVLAPDVRDARTRERFQLEARAIAALKHPNIVELYDYAGDGGTDLYLVLEYVPGPSLADLLDQRGPLGERMALCVGHELSLALRHALRFKVVHRDIKPANVLLDRGRVVLADFGVIKVLEASAALGVEDVATSTQSIGTPGFMAPEQFTGRGIDHRTDIFAVGAVLYNLATGKVPYGGPAARALYRGDEGVLIPPRQHDPSLSEEFERIVTTCLSRKPRDRFADPEALREALLGALARQGVHEVRRELEAYEAGASGEVAARALSAPLKTAPGSSARLVAASLVTAGVLAGFVLCLLLSALGQVPLAWTRWFERVADLLSR